MKHESIGTGMTDVVSGSEARSENCLRLVFRVQQTRKNRWPDGTVRTGMGESGTRNLPGARDNASMNVHSARL